jgi:hypothetical protein
MYSEEAPAKRGRGRPAMDPEEKAKREEEKMNMGNERKNLHNQCPVFHGVSMNSPKYR